MCSVCPALTGDEEPQLPGGCRMGSLTDVGFQNALDLGAQLRHNYIDQVGFMDSSQGLGVFCRQVC